MQSALKSVDKSCHLSMSVTYPNVASSAIEPTVFGDFPGRSGYHYRGPHCSDRVTGDFLGQSFNQKPEPYYLDQKVFEINIPSLAKLMAEKISKDQKIEWVECSIGQLRDYFSASENGITKALAIRKAGAMGVATLLAVLVNGEVLDREFVVNAITTSDSCMLSGQGRERMLQRFYELLA